MFSFSPLQVVSQGESIGPAEVTLLLKKPGSDQILQQTTSVTGGDYSFEKVLPGEYIVEGTHSKWVLKPVSIRKHEMLVCVELIYIYAKL